MKRPDVENLPSVGAINLLTLYAARLAKGDIHFTGKSDIEQ